MYDKGPGVDQDYHQAMEWYLKAANQGQAMAQNNIGVMYHHGHGVDQDYHQAIFWNGIRRLQNKGLQSLNMLLD